MMLREVGSVLQRLGAATLTQLAVELSARPSEVAPLLEFWERRGDVRRCARETTPVCGRSCRRCPIGARGPASPATASRGSDARAGAIVYEWVRPARSSPAAQLS